MWKWLAIGIGALSVLIAFVLSRFSLSSSLLGWLLAAILAAQLTALVQRKWRISLLAPLAAFAVLFANYLWFNPCKTDPCVVVVAVPAPSR